MISNIEKCVYSGDMISSTQHIIDSANETGNVSVEILENFRLNLNKIFPDFTCENVMFTKNEDNVFFGIAILPKYNRPIISMIENDIDNSNGTDDIYAYNLEFDSKLFNMDLDPGNIIHILLNDINKYNSKEPIFYVKNAIDSICTYKSISTNLRRFDNHDARIIRLFEYVIWATIRNHISSFSSYNIKEKIASGFLADLSLFAATNYEEAMDKVRKNLPSILFTELECENTLLLNWYLDMRYYSNIDDRYILNLLKKYKHYTGSKIEKKLIYNAISGLNVLDNRSLLDEKILTESSKNKKKSLFDKIKLNGLKGIEEDIYEYKMRLKNVETENDAILLMRQINSRMAMIDDYLMSEEDLNERERDRWYKLYEKYDSIREKLSEKNVYNRKMYGLFVDYNALQQMSNNNLTMNTYY